MKRFINLLKNAKGAIDREFVIYTAAFFVLMLIIYTYMIFAGMLTAPQFTYAAF